MAKDLSTAPEPPVPPLQPTHTVRVALTPRQRESIHERTGRDLEYVDIPDDDHELTSSMHERTQDEISYLALRVAEDQKAWEEEYHAYLMALAAWQDAEDDPVQTKLEAIEEDAQAKVEAMQAAIADFYAAEIAAIDAARAAAVEAWDPTGKKRKKDS